MAFSYDAGTSTPNLAGLVEIGSIRINDGTFQLIAANGLLLGTPDTRDAVSDLPSDSGGFLGRSFYSARAILLEGQVRVPTVPDLWGARDLLNTVFSLDAGLQTLTVDTSGWSAARQLGVIVSGKVEIVSPSDFDAHHVGNRDFTVGLIAPDPRMYAAALQTATVTTTNLTNHGNASTPLVVRFNGPRTNPQLIGPGLTGRLITYSGAIASGHWVEVGTNPTGDGTGVYAVDDTGADVTPNLTDFTARLIPPGVTSWGTTSSAGAGNIDVSFRDAWY